MILLSQVNRKGETGATEITLDMARGSGAVEESADTMLGLWQVENGEEKGLVCKILKNRKGAPGSCWKLDIKPKTFQFFNTATRYKQLVVKKKTSY